MWTRVVRPLTKASGFKLVGRKGVVPLQWTRVTSSQEEAPPAEASDSSDMWAYHQGKLLLFSVQSKDEMLNRWQWESYDLSRRIGPMMECEWGQVEYFRDDRHF